MENINPDLLVELLDEDLGSIGASFLSSDMSTEYAFKLWLRNAFVKKFTDREDPSAHQLAVDKFLLYNEKCRLFKIEPKQLYDEEIIGGVRSLLDDWLHPDGVPATLADLTRDSELGSGANIGAESHNFYTKLFDSNLTATSEDLYRYYAGAISGNPTWSLAEMQREFTYGHRVVKASSLSTVPKQFDIKRTICTEPTLNMFFQRGIGNFMELCLKRVGINLSTQPDKNRELARIGSLTGAYGTTDLRSASDSISITIVRHVFPRYFVDWLMRTRSGFARLPTGELVELHMVSSMGNGFTFPLQTMLFAAIVRTCYSLLGLKASFGSARDPVDPRKTYNAGVFGDDIAVRSDAYALVNRALGLFGFEVNDDKSFNNGPFRESCGRDYFRGTDIRGVYLRSLATEQDCFSAINRLVRWMARSGINLDLTVSYLLGSVTKLPIPFRDGDDEGIKVPWSCSKISYFSINTRNPLYRARCNTAISFSVPDDADQCELKFRRGKIPYAMRYNPNGMLVAFIGGYIKDGRIAVRPPQGVRPRSKVRQRSVPYWDYIPTAEVVELRDGGWEATVNALFERIEYQLGS